jgi:hypothetical protein
MVHQPSGQASGQATDILIQVESSEVVCTVRLAIGFLLILSKWCAQSLLDIGF